MAGPMSFQQKLAEIREIVDGEMKKIERPFVPVLTSTLITLPQYTDQSMILQALSDLTPEWELEFTPGSPEGALKPVPPRIEVKKR